MNLIPANTQFVTVTCQFQFTIRGLYTSASAKKEIIISVKVSLQYEKAECTKYQQIDSLVTVTKIPRVTH